MSWYTETSSPLAAGVERTAALLAGTRRADSAAPRPWVPARSLEIEPEQLAGAPSETPAALPDLWLEDTPDVAGPEARRAAYAEHLRRRRDRHAELAEEAERARGA